MGFLALLLVAWAGWMIWTGRLQRLTGLDGLMLGLAIVGALSAAKGRFWFGGGLLVVAIVYGVRRWPQLAPVAASRETAELADARKLLGLGPDYDAAAVREAHRRLIARVHPDVGGTSALAEQINMARDSLLTELERRNRARPQ
jgi:hypothetical protein